MSNMNAKGIRATIEFSIANTFPELKFYLFVARLKKLYINN